MVGPRKAVCYGEDGNMRALGVKLGAWDNKEVETWRGVESVIERLDRNNREGVDRVAPGYRHHR